MEYLNAFLSLLNEMSPFLLLGFFFAGLLHVYVPKQIYARYLSHDDFRSVLWATLFGIPLPLCSCGVIPTAMSLRNEGASEGATTSFLIATPQTGVDSIMATYSLLGLPFAVTRPFVALITALFSGVLVNKANAGKKTSAKKEICPMKSEKTETKNRFFSALRYGYVDMLQDIGKWLVFGLVIAGLITIFVPQTFFEQYSNTPLKNMFLVLLFSVPTYLCATGAIPIAAALMLKGMSPGAALVLLVAGPATNMASILVIRKVMGAKTMLIYLTTIVVCAIGFGLIVDYFLPANWFVPPMAASQACCTAHFPWFKVLCSILLVALLANAYFLKHHEHNHKIITNTMTTTYKVNGMKCNHCKANVEKNLENLGNIKNAVANLENGTVTIDGDASEDEIKKTVENLGFEFAGKA